MYEYEELAKRLKIAVEWADKGLRIPPSLCLEVADAIEKLTAYVRQIEELRKDGYYLQKIEMTTYGNAIMTMPLPQPPAQKEKS